MPKTNSLPCPANISDIIDDLFQNEKITNSDHTLSFYTFTCAKLTEQQKTLLIYPFDVTNIIPLDLYILYQVDKFSANGEFISSFSELVSMVKRSDGFIYGYYFNLLNQERYSISKLSNVSSPLSLSTSVEITYGKYIEAYNNVMGTTIILGLGVGDENNKPYASLQYSNKNEYYYESLFETGIDNPDAPKTIITSLSENLKCI